MKKQTKIILSIAYLISLAPMMLPQYGGARGVQEIQGFINLLNPIGLTSVVLFYVGIWVPIKKDSLRKIIGLMGCIGMVFSEIYQFLTWHIMTISGKFSLTKSFRFAYPEFYVGLGVSVIMILVYLYFTFSKKAEQTVAKH